MASSFKLNTTNPSFFTITNNLNHDPLLKNARRRFIFGFKVFASSSSSGSAEVFEEGQLERPKWTGETPLSRLVGALISIKPLFSVLKLGARQVLISTAEKTNIPWREMTKEILDSDVYKELESIENPAIVYPDSEVEAATMSMVRRAIPYASSLDEANQIVRGNWLDAIEKHHQQYSAEFLIKDILDIGCSVGVSTRYIADRYPSAKVTVISACGVEVDGVLEELGTLKLVSSCCLLVVVSTGKVDSSLDLLADWYSPNWFSKTLFDLRVGNVDFDCLEASLCAVLLDRSQAIDGNFGDTDMGEGFEGLGVLEKLWVLRNDGVVWAAMGLDLSPYFLSVAQFKENKRNQRKNPISWIHANGENTGLLSKSFDLVSIAYVILLNVYVHKTVLIFLMCVQFHECPERAIRNVVKESFRLLRPGGTIAITDNSPKSKILQELPPVLFTLMKSTEPFLDEYYLTDLERVMKETGFANVQTVLTDPRHRTVTATVPY
ncbi:hypothetical protein RND71_015412 [Anisodus tanguticus]|uniref:Methyltransferase type 11 domain-containing protein n=1 Tax=Anisodus tanguticus TaxID=243964 RepID=A0AAE1S6V2_9SOLA|nr:hypothetical protein RND71_015412 [Anisodus tanguticus]